MEQDLIYRSLRAKESELEELEIFYRRDKRELANKWNAIDEIFRFRTTLINQEAEQARQFVRTMKVSDSSFLNGYYSKLTEFLDETELAHKIEQGKLEVEEEDLREAFYKKRALYEEDIEELRREYAKTFE